MIEEYNNQDKAFRDISILLSKHTDRPISVRNGFNRGRSKIVKIDDKKLLLIYKREYFKTFTKKFKVFSDKNNITCVGESINVTTLKKALDANIDIIVFIHDDKLLCTNPKVIKRYCELHELVRVQHKTNYYYKCIEQEETYSFPVDILIEFDCSNLSGVLINDI